ncbi:MAG: hypothetical protein PPP56_09820 [Longimonas sp.]|uniref:hypothetical protein n=1 Tax=Longimonas sp. TaxID=2039626 RepID=UPI003346682A
MHYRQPVDLLFLDTVNDPIRAVDHFPYAAVRVYPRPVEALACRFPLGVPDWYT